MSTQRNPHEFSGEPGTAANDFADAAEGDLFIRDLASTSTPAPRHSASSGPDDEGYDDDGDEGVVTTMMLGEEGERSGGREKDTQDDDIMTTLALGEEARGE